jgi:hypothetical protein
VFTDTYIQGEYLILMYITDIAFTTDIRECRLGISRGMDPRLGCSPLALVSATTRECQLGISGGMDPQLGGSPLALVFATTRECQLGISGGMDPRFGGSPLALVLIKAFGSGAF